MTEYFKRQPSTKEIHRRIEGFQSWLEIDLDSISHNLEAIKEKTRVEVIPCVKSNAYGHGIIGSVAYLEKKGITRVLVAKLWEAKQLRESGINIGIINMDPLYTKEQYEQIVKLGATQTIYHKESAKMLNAASKKHDTITETWIKIDTGLGRVGVRWNEAVKLIKHINTLPHLKIEGIFSTLSEANELDQTQVKRLKDIDNELNQQGIHIKTKSIASSNAIFHKPYSYLNAVRPGLMLFGMYPEETDKGHEINLKQSLCFKARLEHIKWVEKGEALTYSRRFIAQKRMKVGTVHIGYSDGYPRNLTKKGLVKVEGKIKRVLGTVSVNHFLVDLDETNAKIGDIIEAISNKGDNDAGKVAELAGIMTYSLANQMNILIPRVYLEKGEPVALYQPKLVE
jgi:alanine racemase